jgi:hypothetical protein
LGDRCLTRDQLFVWGSQARKTGCRFTRCQYGFSIERAAADPHAERPQAKSQPHPFKRGAGGTAVRPQVEDTKISGPLGYGSCRS